MGGEDVARTGGDESLLEGDRVGLHVEAGPLENGERRVALVQVAHVGSDAQLLEQPPSADAERDLLLEPHLGAPAVQVAR